MSVNSVPFPNIRNLREDKKHYYTGINLSEAKELLGGNNPRVTWVTKNPGDFKIRKIP